MKGTWQEVSRDHVGLIAAGIAFYALLAIFPFIATLVSAWALLADPATIERQIAAAAQVMPSDAADIFASQARAVSEGAGGGVTFAAIAGIVLSLWSSSKGIAALMEGLNIAYDEEDQRSFVRQTMVKLALSVAIVVGAFLGIACTMILPAIIGQLGMGDVGRTLATVLRWPLLFALVVAGLAVIYRFAPARPSPHWAWVSPGALAATALWVAGSILFSIYVRNFGSYNETYGSLGAVVIALMWFWLSAFIVLMGAEFNAELERRMGKRPAREETHRHAVG
jgi:membrane protein